MTQWFPFQKVNTISTSLSLTQTDTYCNPTTKYLKLQFFFPSSLSQTQDSQLDTALK